MILRLIALLWPAWASACTLCQGYDAVIFPRLSVEANTTHLQTITVEWPFTQSLTARVVANFDRNQNGRLDPDELAVLVQTWEAELAKTGYYTLLELDGKTQTVTNPSERRFELEGEHALYRFALALNHPIASGSSVAIRFFEPMRTLSFFFDRQSLPIVQAQGWRVEDNLAAFPHTLKLTFTPQNGSLAGPLAAAPEETVSLSGLIKNAFDRLRLYFETLRDQPGGAVFWGLLGFSFLYGLLHAAGPGHGKTLVASYFFATGGGWKRAAVMAFLIGAVHIFSALILTALLLFALNVVFATALEDASKWLTRLSGVLILLIAGHLFYRRFKNRPPKTRFSAHPPACGCGSCGAAGGSKDLGVVIAAGIIPCPGTVTIFLFALSMGLYFTGLAAAVAMSLGMGTVIVLSAALGSAAKNLLQGRAAKLTGGLEILSILLIGVLGILLLLS